MFDSIAHHVDPNAICLELHATDWRSVLAILGWRLVESGNVRPEFILSTIAREQDRPTGVRLRTGPHVALPRTEPWFVVRPCLAVATLAHPVMFGAMDAPGELVPVRLVLLLASRERAAHVRAAKRIAGILQDHHAVERMVGSPSIAYVAASICHTGSP